MVSQSSYGSIIWFLNHHMVSIIWFPLYGFHYMVSQSSYGSIIWFLNHHMVPLYGFSIINGSIIWFLNQKMVSQNMVSQSKFGKLYVSKSDKCVQPLIPANVHQSLIPAVSGQSKNGFYVMGRCASL